jgi:hypothetical protein
VHFQQEDRVVGSKKKEGVGISVIGEHSWQIVTDFFTVFSAFAAFMPCLSVGRYFYCFCSIHGFSKCHFLFPWSASTKQAAGILSSLEACYEDQVNGWWWGFMGMEVQFM